MLDHHVQFNVYFPCSMASMGLLDSKLPFFPVMSHSMLYILPSCLCPFFEPAQINHLLTRQKTLYDSVSQTSTAALPFLRSFA